MDKRGFLLIEVLLGLFLLGTIAVTCLPILNTAINNMKMTKKKIDMVFLAESTMEQIRGINNSFNDEYIFDIKIEDLLSRLNTAGFVTVNLALNNRNNDCEYYCTITKNNIGEKLWKISIEISSSVEENRIENVILQSIIPSSR